MPYTVEIWRDGETGIEQTLLATEDIAAARQAYRAAVTAHPGRLVMLCNRAMILRRSDRDGAG